MKNSKIKIFYKPQMAYEGKENSYSNSPRKPKLFVDRLKKRSDFKDRFEIVSNWKAFERHDFFKAHDHDYVLDFFKGVEPVCSSNGIKWSKDFAETVRYTNASLYQAIRHSYLHPGTICCSPTSGFHHAQPSHGSGFCTFSGQVIASIKLHEEFGISGFYFDLDGHFGNSIEDTRKDKRFKKIVNQAIPKYANFNPMGEGKNYLESLDEGIEKFIEAAISKKIHYVVWCHGADSHKNDNLGHQVNTYQWLLCTKKFTDAIEVIEKELKEQFPVSYALFGGYRENYSEVLYLHEQDTEMLLDICVRKEKNLIDLYEERRAKR